ncbi:MAG: hypothetical protein KC729_00015 [Candidatus Eisenbacteria bacterium]|uniref:Transposase n=1 Tax=Eiseniibacteriota bacterium TaxID=2212470 RepID=A0A956LV40_UNCEI|nr:hypothetical protein [Candidatus Eisenbacteria bacterium]
MTKDEADELERATLSDSTMSPERATNPDLTAFKERTHLYTVALQFQSIQRVRVALQLSCEGRPEQAPTFIRDKMMEIEKDVVKYMADQAKMFSVWPWLSDIKGIGPRIGGMLLGLIDIRRANTPSALWRYAGLGTSPWCVECNTRLSDRETVCPKCGTAAIHKADRPIKGEKLRYNAKLKKTCFLVARQFIMAGTEPYTGIYREKKAHYLGRGMTAGNADLAARRVAVKIFLVHLWEEWRKAEGLPVRDPYVKTYLGHQDIIPSRNQE